MPGILAIAAVLLSQFYRQVVNNKCPLCNATTTRYSEEIITQCVITVSTALHHMPVLTSYYLIHVIKALARVTLPDAFSWDNTRLIPVNIQGCTFIFFIAELKIIPLLQPAM